MKITQESLRKTAKEIGAIVKDKVNKTAAVIGVALIGLNQLITHIPIVSSATAGAGLGFILNSKDTEKSTPNHALAGFFVGVAALPFLPINPELASNVSTAGFAYAIGACARGIMRKNKVNSSQ